LTTSAADKATCRAPHRRGGVTPKAGLKGPRDGLADLRQRGLRPGNRVESIHDVVRQRVDTHLEELFTGLRVIRQRSVCKAEPGGIVQRTDRVENAANYEDFIAAVRWLIDRADFEGVVNVAAPNPLPNAEFMRVLRQACGIRLGLPARTWMLELGAVLLRTETELVLKSRRVVPARLLEEGFRFKYPDWRGAAFDLCQQWKNAPSKARAA